MAGLSEGYPAVEARPQQTPVETTMIKNATPAQLKDLERSRQESARDLNNTLLVMTFDRCVRQAARDTAREVGRALREALWIHGYGPDTFVTTGMFG